jgi:hypothetical protein
MFVIIDNGLLVIWAEEHSQATDIHDSFGLVAIASLVPIDLQQRFRPFPACSPSLRVDCLSPLSSFSVYHLRLHLLLNVRLRYSASRFSFCDFLLQFAAE